MKGTFIATLSIFDTLFSGGCLMEPTVKPKVYAKYLQFEGASLTRQIMALRQYEKAYKHVLLREDSVWLRITIPNLIRIRMKQIQGSKK